MNVLRRVSLWFVLALLASPAALAAAPHTNYAIIFSGGGNPANNHPRYYEETLRMWRITTGTLGFPLENVYVLFADGLNTAADRTSFTEEFDDNPANWESSDWDAITDVGGIIRPGTKGDLEETFNEVADQITANDSFYFWAFNHGFNPAFPKCPNTPKAPNDPNNGSQPNTTTPAQCEVVPPGTNVSLVAWDEGLVSDVAFAGLADLISAKHPLAEAYAFAECFGGGMVDNLFPHPRRFAAFAAAVNECSLGKSWADAWATGLESGFRSTVELGFFAQVGDQHGGGPGLGKETPGFMGYDHDIVTNQAISEPATLLLLGSAAPIAVFLHGRTRRRR